MLPRSSVPPLALCTSELDDDPSSSRHGAVVLVLPSLPANPECLHVTRTPSRSPALISPLPSVHQNAIQT